MPFDTIDRSPFDHLALLVLRISELEREEAKCRAAATEGVDVVGPSVDSEKELLERRRILAKLVGRRRERGGLENAREEDCSGRNDLSE